MFNMVNNCCWSVIDYAKKEVKELEDVPKVLVSRALVSGVAYVAFSTTARVFSFLCQQAGFSSLANRVALPALTSNIWVPVAVIIVLPSLITLYQLIKNYDVEEEETPTELISAEELAKSAKEAYEKIEEALKQPGSIPEKDLFNEVDQRILYKKRISLFDFVYEKYPKYIISLTNGSQGLGYNWESSSDLNYASLPSNQKRSFSLFMVDIKRKIESAPPNEKVIEYSCVKPREEISNCLIEYFSNTHTITFKTGGATITKK